MNVLNKIGTVVGVIGMSFIFITILVLIGYVLWTKLEYAYDRRKIKTAVKDWLDQEPTNVFEVELCKEVALEKLRNLKTLDFSNEILVERYSNLIIQGSALYYIGCDNYKRLVKEDWNNIFGKSNEN